MDVHLPYYIAHLNEKERALFKQSRRVGLLVLAQAYRAIQAAKQLYEEDTQYNGNGDAFRHACWSFLMASNPLIGEDWAKQWGDAHEEGDPGNTPLEMEMDKHNNAVGREYARLHYWGNHGALIGPVRNGQCRIIALGTLQKSSSAGEKESPYSWS